MVFSSLEFLFVFLPVTLLVYFCVPHKVRNLVLLLFSLFFYGWGEPVYVFLMIFTILIDYLGGWFVGKWRDEKPRAAKAALVVSILINLGMLGFFKYYDFFVSNLARIPCFSSLQPLGLTLPIGISFYTFQSLSYVIDVYRRETDAQKNLLAFGTYVTLFPQLIAGPIVRYRDVDDQLTNRTESVALFASGVRTFLCGLAKKVLLANAAGQIFDSLKAGEGVSAFGAWFGLLFYLFQIYFDFSGYSDMAVGLGKMFGFRFLENFDYPYIATSITDFWRRWHISLSTWFLDYVYIPLGGNRRGTLKTWRNLLIVWLCTGFWHGASWNYILWGLYYFVLLAIEKLFLYRALEKIPRFFRHAYTLLFVYFGWLLFTFEDGAAGIAYLCKMFGASGTALWQGSDLWLLLSNLVFLCILVIASTPYPKRLFWRLWKKSGAARAAAAAGGAALLILCVAYLVNSSYNPFLYFRF